MSKTKQVEKASKKAVEEVVEAVETVVEETVETEAQPEVVEEKTTEVVTEVEEAPVVEEEVAVEEKVVEPAVEPTPAPVKKEVPVRTTEVENTNVVSVRKTEEQLLAEKLDLQPIGRDIRTNTLVYPSTPLMRAMLAKKEAETQGNLGQSQLEELFAKEYGETAANLSGSKYVIAILAEYTDKMNPKNAIDEVKGGEMQAKLAKMFDAVLSYEPEHCMVCLEFIVKVFKVNLNTCFHEMYALRFINTVRLNQEQSFRFQMLTTLFMELARGLRGNELGQVVNIRKLLDFVTDRNAKANLSEFLS